jgi:hypothetical protein
MLSAEDTVRKLLAEHRYLEATYALEFLLISAPSNLDARMVLAEIYIALKENAYRFRAGEHLEFLVEHAGGDLLNRALTILISNVYLTHGPSDKIEPLLNKFKQILDPIFCETALRKSEELNEYVKSADTKKSKSLMPDRVGSFINFDSAINNYIFNEFRLSESASDFKPRRFFTFGSCFARHVAREMLRRGLDVESFWVGEEVNTTFSNVNLIKYILNLSLNNPDYYHDLLQGSDTQRLKSKLIEADAVIFTLGVAPAFFNHNQEYIPHSPSNLRIIKRNTNIQYRFSTPEENKKVLYELKDILQTHTNAKKLYLTVSPVPLAASLLSRSAPVDDSESKSILRTTAGMLRTECPDFFTYFPSFEVFRWLSCFRDEAAFGASDGNTRHANDQMVVSVVDAFIKITNA